MSSQNQQLSLDDLALVTAYEQEQEQEEQRQLAYQQAGQQRALAWMAEHSEELKAAEILRVPMRMTLGEAAEMLKEAGGFYALARLPKEIMMGLPHMTAKRAEILMAMTKWALLISSPSPDERPQIRSHTDAANLVMLEMGLLEREELWVIGLDNRNRVVFREAVYRGALNRVSFRVAEIFQRAASSHCAAIVLAHNHPSGDPTPSPEDVGATETIRQAGELLNIEVMDHLVIGRNRYVSMKERGLGFR